MDEKTVVLITGCNRGIGKGLLSAYVLRPNHIVIAGVRDPSSSASKALLHDVPHGAGSKVILIKIDSASSTDAREAVQALQADHGIDRIDVVIANAGISNYFGKATVTPVEQMLDHFRINAVAPLLLFQATAPLLQLQRTNAAKTTTTTTTTLLPKFVVISSGAGSISGIVNLPVENTAYGASKATLNFVTRRIHYENPNLIAFPINPGWLQTDLGNHAATGAGMSVAPVSVKDGVAGVIAQIDKATREETSGRFMSFDGKQLDW